MQKGIYKTISGHRAIVAQLLSVGSNQWVLRGAIDVDGLLCMCSWFCNGKHIQGNSNLDLFEKA